MQFEKASNTDYQGILDLQHKNLLHNLTDAEKKEGVIYGYLCTSSPEFNQSFELPTAMIALYPQLSYHEKTLNQYHSIVAGPWCIERKSRGKSIFINMWHALNKILAKDIELITTFISTHNPRSLYAAKKVGMEEITTFKFNEKEFCLLAKINS